MLDTSRLDLHAENIEELQYKLVDCIVGQRLYKDHHLQLIFDEAVKQNAYTLGEDNVRELCDAVLADLDQS